MMDGYGMEFGMGLGWIWLILICCSRRSGERSIAKVLAQVKV